VVTGSGAVLARLPDGQLVNLLPHVSAAVALHGRGVIRGLVILAV